MRPLVHGRVLDAATRCVHYHGPADVVALRFPCCDRFYPCHRCHDEEADHPPARWPRGARDAPAVLCGVCGTVLTIAAYLAAESRCPACGAAFNPGCRAHWPLYFEGPFDEPRPTV